MKNFFIISIALLIPCLSQACDFDGDGVDDPTAYTEETGTLRVLQSSNNTISLRVLPGDLLYLVPGNYLGTDQATNYAYINSDYFWKISLPDEKVSQISSFGNSDATIITGHDFDGDGLDDAAKVLNTCKNLTKTCHKRNPSYNFIFNNVVDGIPFKDITLLTKFFSKGLSPVFVMDVNNDGSDDLCYGDPIRSNKKKFKAICKNVADQAILKKFKIGKIFKLPLSAKINGKSFVVQWKPRKRTNETKIKLIDPNGADTIKLTIPSAGKTLIGDWLGTGSDQIAVASGSLLTIYNPLDGQISVKTMPSGSPLDCNNNRYGRATSIFLKTRNVCKVLSCK